MKRSDAMSGYDVVVIGEALVEMHSTEALREASSLRLSFSGDALNAAAAAAPPGATVALLTAIGDDELGDALLERLNALGVDRALVRRSERPNGAYIAVSDMAGEREFIYWRTESAGSTLSPLDIERHAAILKASRALVVSGVSAALSQACEEAVVLAARSVFTGGGHVTYDPNFRRRLTTPEQARNVLEKVAPFAGLVTPSCPGDSQALLGTTDPNDTVSKTLSLGAAAVAVTAGANNVTVGSHARRFTVVVPRVLEAVDATGAGDVFTGTTTARLALGDTLETAVRLGIAAASLSTTGRGGTGYLPPLDESCRAAHFLEEPVSVSDGPAQQRLGTTP
jgi:2-dehydro-3-deoxygluconokinase